MDWQRRRSFSARRTAFDCSSARRLKVCSSRRRSSDTPRGGFRVTLRFFKTPKGLLTLILALLLAIAIPIEGFTPTWVVLTSAIGVAALVDAVILRYRRGAWEYPSGAVLTGAIIAMVLSPHEPWYVAATAAAVGVFSKYVFRLRTANIFNPAAL